MPRKERPLRQLASIDLNHKPTGDNFSLFARFAVAPASFDEVAGTIEVSAKKLTLQIEVDGGSIGLENRCGDNLLRSLITRKATENIETTESQKASLSAGATIDPTSLLSSKMRLEADGRADYGVKKSQNIKGEHELNNLSFYAGPGDSWVVESLNDEPLKDTFLNITNALCEVIPKPKANRLTASATIKARQRDLKFNFINHNNSLINKLKPKPTDNALFQILIAKTFAADQLDEYSGILIVDRSEIALAGELDDDA